jgi:cytochrome c5
MTPAPGRLASRLAGLVLAAAAVGVASPCSASGRDGRAVYEAVCASCHATGVLRAPRFGDAAAWKPLIAEGQRSLVRTAIKGIRQMPPKGGDPSLSAVEVERAVVYMANAAGARFKDPP